MGRATKLLIGLVVTSILLLGLCGCGSAPPPPPTTPSTLSQAAASVSASEDYKAELANWAKTYLVPLDFNAISSITNPLHPTQKQVSTVENYAAGVNTALVALRAMTPPAEIAGAHVQLVEGFSLEARATRQILDTLQSGNLRELAGVMQMAIMGQKQVEAAATMMGPYLGLSSLMQA